MGSLPSMMPRLRPGSARTGRIDRLGWRAGTCFDAYGLRVGVRTNAPALLDRLGPHLPPGWRACASPLVDQIFSVWVDLDDARRPSRVYAGRSRRVRTADLAHAFAVLESEIRQSVAAGAERRTFVHAGVVGWRGRAIVIPGRSRSGKTTLVAELVKAGALYLSDEFAVLDGRGRVHPFAKPLSIRGASGCDRHAQAPARGGARRRLRDGAAPGGARGPRGAPAGRHLAAGAPDRGAGGDRDARAHGAGAPPAGGLARVARACRGAGDGAEGRAGRGSRAGGAPAAVRRGEGIGLPSWDGRGGDDDEACGAPGRTPDPRAEGRAAGLRAGRAPGALPQPHRGHGVPERRRDADGRRPRAPPRAPRATGRPARRSWGRPSPAWPRQGFSKAGRPPPAGRAGRWSAGSASGRPSCCPAVASIVAPTPAEAAATCVTSCAGKAGRHALHLLTVPTPAPPPASRTPARTAAPADGRR